MLTTIPSTPQPLQRRSATPATAAASSVRVRTPASLKVMLLERQDELSGNVLPRCLSRGIAYAAAVGDITFLLNRNVLTLPEEEKTHIRPEEAEELHAARCSDQRSSKSVQNEKIKIMRYERFHEVLCTSCKGRNFVLRQCGLGEDSARVIRRILELNVFYTVVDLSGNAFGDIGARHIAATLRTNTTVVVLILLSASFGPDGVTAIADALLTNNTLTYLDLSGMSGLQRNHFGLKGCQSFARVLQQNQVLSTLRISSCGLDRVGAAQLLQHLGRNGSLTDVMVASNQLSSTACEALATSLHANHCPLQVLDLTRTKIGQYDLKSFALGLSCHTSIQTLILTKCQIRSESLVSLAIAMPNTVSLENVVLDDNP